MTAADGAELASMATAVSELTDRVAALAERYRDSPRDDVAGRLYEAERAMVQATRVLQHLGRELR